MSIKKEGHIQGCSYYNKAMNDIASESIRTSEDFGD